MISAFVRARNALVAAPFALSMAMAVMTSPAAADMAIKIDNFVFTPDTTEIAVGTTVTWTNDDDIPHAVGANDLSWRSHAMDTGESFSYTFTKPGIYEYFCTLHPHMKGKIVVK
jgi:plastocyanin